MSDTLKEYYKLAGKRHYGFTRNGDTPLDPTLEQVSLLPIIDNQTLEFEALNAQRKDDAEKIASYILDFQPTEYTIDTQNHVRHIRDISQLSDDELKAEGYDRQSVTTALEQANEDFHKKQKFERRVPVIGKNDLV